MRSALAWPIAIALAAAGLPLRAVADGPPTTEEGLTVNVVSVNDSRFPEVQVELRVSRSGAGGIAWTAPAATALESAVPAEITSVEATPDPVAPIAVVVVMDVSESMRGPSLATAKTMAKSLVRTLAPGDLAALVTFSSSVSLVTPLTSDQALLNQAIDGLEANGNTALYQAVSDSAALAKGLTAARRTVILISDGGEFGGWSKVSREESLSLAAAAGAPFHVLAIGERVDMPYLTELAAASRGAVQAGSESTAVGLLQSMQAASSGRVRLTLMSGGDPDLRQRTLTVTIRQGGLAGSVAHSYASLRPPVAPPVQPPAVVPVEVPQPPLATGNTTAPEPVAAPPKADFGLVPADMPPPSLPSGFQPWWAMAGMAALLLVALSAMRLRRRQVLVPAMAVPGPSEPALPNVSALRLPRARLVATTGPLAGTSVEVSDEPVSFGSATGCSLSLPAGAEVAPEHARVWWRDGRLMLHNLARGYVTRVGGQESSWKALTHDDDIAIGPHTFRVMISDS